MNGIEPKDNGWRARLALGFERRDARTVLAHAEHAGPLRVQRAFHPEGPACPHVYLLHPPGGLVPGDALDIDLALAAGSRALITTPASGKVYGVGERRLPQRQTVSARVGDAATLEWLPQDTIVFDGADATLESRFDLGADARLVAWEIVTLGRAAGDAPFRQGRVRQRLNVTRHGAPLIDERIDIRGGSPMLDARWGLGGNRVFGTLVATGTVDAAGMAALRALGEARDDAFWSCTTPPGLVLARYLGCDAREALALMQSAWSLLRPVLLGSEAVPPRVWAT